MVTQACEIPQQELLRDDRGDYVEKEGDIWESDITDAAGSGTDRLSPFCSLWFD